MPEYVYIKAEAQLWTVGFYNPQGEWVPESDHASKAAASNKVHFLNGGSGDTFIAEPQDIDQMAVAVDGILTELERIISQWFRNIPHKIQGFFHREERCTKD